MNAMKMTNRMRWFTRLTFSITLLVMPVRAIFYDHEWALYHVVTELVAMSLVICVWWLTQGEET